MHEAHHTSGEESGKYVEGEGVGGGGSPSHTREFFAFLGFKISDLVHTFGEFVGVQPVRKELEGEGVGEGIPLPHRGVFAFLEFKICDLVHTFGEFVKHCLSKTSEENIFFTACFSLKWKY